MLIFTFLFWCYVTFNICTRNFTSDAQYLLVVEKDLLCMIASVLCKTGKTETTLKPLCVGTEDDVFIGKQREVSGTEDDVIIGKQRAVSGTEDDVIIGKQRAVNGTEDDVIIGKQRALSRDIWSSPSICSAVGYSCL